MAEILLTSGGLNDSLNLMDVTNYFVEKKGYTVGPKDKDGYRVLTLKVLVQGKTTDQLNTNQVNLSYKLEQGKLAYGPNGIGAPVLLWSKLGDNEVWTYWTVIGGTIKFMDIAASSEYQMEAELAIKVLCEATSDPVTLPTSPAITSNQPLFLPYTKGECSALLNLIVTNTGSIPITKLWVSRFGHKNLQAPDFRSHYSVPGSVLLSNSWQNVGNFTSLQGKFDAGIFDIVARIKDSSRPLLTISDLNGVVLPSGGLSGGFYEYVVTSIDQFGQESAASGAFNITVPTGSILINDPLPDPASLKWAGPIFLGGSCANPGKYSIDAPGLMQAGPNGLAVSCQSDGWILSNTISSPFLIPSDPTSGNTGPTNKVPPKEGELGYSFNMLTSAFPQPVTGQAIYQYDLEVTNLTLGALSSPIFFGQMAPFGLMRCPYGWALYCSEVTASEDSSGLVDAWKSNKLQYVLINEPDSYFFNTNRTVTISSDWRNGTLVATLSIDGAIKSTIDSTIKGAPANAITLGAIVTNKLPNFGQTKVVNPDLSTWSYTKVQVKSLSSSSSTSTSSSVSSSDSSDTGESDGTSNSNSNSIGNSSSRNFSSNSGSTSNRSNSFSDSSGSSDSSDKNSSSSDSEGINSSSSTSNSFSSTPTSDSSTDSDSTGKGSSSSKSSSSGSGSSSGPTSSSSSSDSNGGGFTKSSSFSQNTGTSNSGSTSTSKNSGNNTSSSDSSNKSTSKSTSSSASVTDPGNIEFDIPKSSSTRLVTFVTQNISTTHSTSTSTSTSDSSSTGSGKNNSGSTSDSNGSSSSLSSSDGFNQSNSSSDDSSTGTSSSNSHNSSDSSSNSDGSNDSKSHSESSGHDTSTSSPGGGSGGGKSSSMSDSSSSGPSSSKSSSHNESHSSGSGGSGSESHNFSNGGGEDHSRNLSNGTNSSDSSSSNSSNSKNSSLSSSTSQDVSVSDSATYENVYLIQPLVDSSNPATTANLASVNMVYKNVFVGDGPLGLNNSVQLNWTPQTNAQNQRVYRVQNTSSVNWLYKVLGGTDATFVDSNQNGWTVGTPPNSFSGPTSALIRLGYGSSSTDTLKYTVPVSANLSNGLQEFKKLASLVLPPGPRPEPESDIPQPFYVVVQAMTNNVTSSNFALSDVFLLPQNQAQFIAEFAANAVYSYNLDHRRDRRNSGRVFNGAALVDNMDVKGELTLSPGGNYLIVLAEGPNGVADPNITFTLTPTYTPRSEFSFGV